MNVLVIGTNKIEQQIINLCLKSKFLDHIYTASFEPLEEIPNIEYNSIEDLIKKSKALYIDVIFIADKNLIISGMPDELRQNKLNVISVNKKWYSLEESRIVAKDLMNYYSINNPEIIKAPLTFPIVAKTDKPEATKIANTMEELIKIREQFANKKMFLEEFLFGEEYYLLSFWDGKNFLHFPLDNLNEVQKERLDIYKTKLHFMLSDEKADFIGFFITKLFWSKNDWHVLEYIMHLNEHAGINNINKDFLYLINMALYQRLNEISY